MAGVACILSGDAAQLVLGTLHGPRALLILGVPDQHYDRSNSNPKKLHTGNRVSLSGQRRTTGRAQTGKASVDSAKFNGKRMVQR